MTSGSAPSNLNIFDLAGGLFTPIYLPPTSVPPSTLPPGTQTSQSSSPTPGASRPGGPTGTTPGPSSPSGTGVTGGRGGNPPASSLGRSSATAIALGTTFGVLALVGI